MRRLFHQTRRCFSVVQNLQQKYRPNSVCFGCGPANPLGLQISSSLFPSSDPTKPPFVTTKFIPRPEHQSFPGVLNAGVVSTLLDCHGTWTAMMNLMHARKASDPPVIISAMHSVKLLRAVPYVPNKEIYIASIVDELREDRAYVKMFLRVDEADAASICATGEGWFTEIKTGCSPCKVIFDWDDNAK